MQLDQALDQRQADAQPALRGLRRAADLHEHLEDRAQHVGCKAGAVVAHLDHRDALLRAQHDADRSAGRRVLGGVVEQVREHLREPHRIAAHHERLAAQVHVQRVPGAFEHGPAQFEGVLDHRIERHGFHAQFDLAARDARDFHEVVHEPHHVVDLAAHEFVVAQRLGGLIRLALQQRQRGAHRRERVAQLVRQRGKKLGLALVGLVQPAQQVAHLVLAVACAQRRAHRAHQRRHAHRPLDDGDVGQPAHRVGNDHRVRSLARQDQHRQVGPRRLRGQRLGQRGGGRIGQRFFGQQDRAGALLQPAHERAEIGAGVRGDLGAFKHGLGHDGVPRSHGAQQDALFDGNGCLGTHDVRCTPSIGTGTPVRMPLKLRSGSPTRSPVAVIEKSRMVRSCAPPRFLSTEMAWRTSPSSSK
ncbi:hypothetical protein D9M72_255950 [compost metagenome]